MIENSLDVPGCIMSNPTVAMAIKMIDFNVSANAKNIVEVSKDKPDGRTKRVFGTVRGMGGGKTRAFEALRRRLLLDEGVFVLAVTYNSYWTDSDKFDLWKGWEGAEHMQIIYALSLISRMASMFYHRSLADTVRSMESCMALFPPTDRFQGEYLIQSFVLYMTEQVSAHREVKTFILLIDEAKRMEKRIFDMYGGKEITSVVQCALLDSQLRLPNQTGFLDVGLAISSLSIGPVIEDRSVREIVPIVLSPKLNTSAIVSVIWNPLNVSKISPEGSYRLELIAATVNNLPRCVEIVNNFIIAKRSISIPLIIDATFVKSLYDDLLINMKGKYANPTCLPSNLLSAIIFGDGVKLNDRVTSDAIGDSVITNSLVKFRQEGYLLRVETSLVMLRVITSRDESDADDGSLEKAISDGLQTVTDEIINNRGEGHIWEVCYYEWLKIRLQAAIEYVPEEHVSPCRKVMNVRKLLGIMNNNIIPTDHFELFTTPLLLPKKKYWKEIRLECKDSYHYKDNANLDVFRKAMEEVTVTANCPVAIVHPADGEAWDLCLKILVPGYVEPMYIFIENKAVDETQRSADKITFNMAETRRQSNRVIDVTDLEGGGKQYTHTEKLMGDNKWVYIYMRTQKSVSFVFNNAIEMGRADSFEYLGPLSEVYQVARSISLSKAKVTK